MVRALDVVFDHTANLRGGEGVCSAGHARRPGVPAEFHVETRAYATIPPTLRFVKKDAKGTWTENLDGRTYGTLTYADPAKRHPIGHDLRSTGSNASGDWTSVDVQTSADTLYRSDTKAARDGSGRIAASGRSEDGKYSLTGFWGKGNVGDWSQRWAGANGRWEVDRYHTHPNGTAQMEVETSAKLRFELAFAASRSGCGTIMTGKGLAGKIEWDNQGDGTINWSDGAVQTFEDWKI